MRLTAMPAPLPLRESDILYEDNHCLVVTKPPRVLTAGDDTGDVSLLDLARDYLKRKYAKPGNVFLGLVHRLDRPVSGVVLFARTSKAAARLAEQFRERHVQKTYQAIVSGQVPAPEAELVHWLLKDRNTNVVRVVPPGTAGSLRSVLRYRRLKAAGKRTLLEVAPETGRSHQIRVQLATSGMPICGDTKYGSTERLHGAIALHAARLTFEHPVRRKPVTVNADFPSFWEDLLKSNV